MEKDSGKALSELAVDGGMSNSDLTMQVCCVLARLMEMKVRTSIILTFGFL